MIEIVLEESAIPVAPRLSDHFAYAALFPAMREFDACTIGGKVSRQVLENLSELNAIWQAWRPGRYRTVEWSASELVDAPVETAHRSGHVMTYSGGVDASVTLKRHSSGQLGWRQRPLKAALLVHGFDIAIADTAGFNRACEKARCITSAANVPLVPVYTNVRDLQTDWEDSHGAYLACILNIFSASYEGGMIAADEPYAYPVLPWGSNPVSNPWLGTRHFPIRTDGAELTRLQKVQLIGGWPVAAENIRVCWEGSVPGDNCGACEKCVRTQLELLACGATLNGNFKSPLKPGMVLNIRPRNPVQLSYLTEVLDHCHRRKVSTWWTQELAQVVQRARDLGFQAEDKKPHWLKRLRRKLFKRR